SRRRRRRAPGDAPLAVARAAVAPIGGRLSGVGRPRPRERLPSRPEAARPAAAPGDRAAGRSRGRRRHSRFHHGACADRRHGGRRTRRLRSRVRASRRRCPGNPRLPPPRGPVDRGDRERPRDPGRDGEVAAVQRAAPSRGGAPARGARRRRPRPGDGGPPVIPLTDELLRRRLVERADQAPDLSLAAIARSVTAEPRRQWLPIAGGRIAILGPIAAVLVVAVAIAGGLLSRVAPPAVSGGSASPGTATASPASIAAWSSLTWEKTSPVPFESDETIVNDAIAVGDGFVAVGTTEANHALTGHVWLSPDGRTWERIDDPGIATLVPARVMAVGDTIVVLGDRRTPGDAAKHVELWRSADGVEWTQGPSLPVPGDAVSAAGGPAGILLPVDRRMFVIGPELDAWTETTTWPADVYLGSPAWADGRWIQPGATGVVGANAPTTATVWTSVDGRAWTARTMTQSKGAAFRVFAAADGLVAIGQSTNLCLFCYGPLIQPQTAWWSADGTAWSAIDLHLRPGDRTEFAGDGRRLLDLTGRLGAGDQPLAQSVSESLDGRTWTPIELVDPAPGANALAGHVVVGSHGVAILPGSSVDRSSGAFHPQPWW